MNDMIIFNHQEHYHGLGCHILEEDGDQVEVWVTRYAHRKRFDKRDILTIEEARKRQQNL